jgi:hypothetical protein
MRETSFMEKPNLYVYIPTAQILRRVIEKQQITPIPAYIRDGRMSHKTMLDQADLLYFFGTFWGCFKIRVTIAHVILSEAKNLSRKRHPRGDSSLRSE